MDLRTLLPLVGLFIGSHALADASVPLTGQFRVNEMGAATYSLPLELPTARAGVTPKFSIDYSSSSGRGYMGVGFSLKANSVITRCPQTFAQDGQNVGVDLTSSDRFCLGGQRLIAVSGAYGGDGTVYRKEIDDQSVIYSYGTASGGGPLAFKVEQKDGDTLYFGQVEGELGLDFRDTAGTGDQDDAARVLKNSAGRNTIYYWAEKGLTDQFGNYISFQYTAGNATEHYLRTVSYGGNLNTGEQPYIKVTIDYINNPHPATGYVLGNPYQRTRLINKITTTVDNVVDSVYQLNYNLSESSLVNEHLSSIQKCTNRNNNDCTPPITFSWNTSKQTKPSIFGSGHSLSKLPVYHVDSAKMMDLSGDGVSDLIYIGHDKWWHIYDPIKDDDITVTSLGHGASQYALPINYNGDGQTDLLVANDTKSNWNVITMLPSEQSRLNCEPDGEGGQLCDRFSWTSQTSVIDTGVKATGIKGKTVVADVDGDGLEDLITVNSDGIVWIRNNNGVFAKQGVPLHFTDNDEEGELERFAIENNFHSSTSSLIDVNGDGKTDLVIQLSLISHVCRVEQGKTAEISSEECRTRHGTWESRHAEKWYVYTSTGSDYKKLQSLPDIGDDYNYHGADINGDGLTDLVFQQDGTWHVMFSNGITFLPAIDTQVPGNKNFDAKTYFLDLNGDGQADIFTPYDGSTYRTYLTNNINGVFSWLLYSANTLPYKKDLLIGDIDGTGVPDFFYADDGYWNRKENLTPQFKNTLKTITDGFGTKTTIEYSRLTSQTNGQPDVYVTQDSSAATETGNYSFVSPLMVTKRVTTETGINSHLSVSYQYGGIAINRLGRGFLGFELLRTIDEQTNVQTDTLYNQSFPLTGTPISTLQSYNGKTLNQSTNTYEVAHPTASDRVYQVNLTKTVEENRQLSSDLSQVYPLSRVVTENRYDSWANPEEIITSTYDLSNGALVAKTLTESEYNGAGGGASKGRLSRTEVTKSRADQRTSVADIQRTTTFTYDGATGALLSSTLAPDDATYRLTTAYRYDSYGNKIKTTVTGRVSSNTDESRTSVTSYGSYGRYLDSETNALGETTTYQYNGTSADNATGPLRSVAITDANGLKVTTTYDAWHRKLTVTQPGNLVTHYEYGTCAQNGCSGFSAAYAYTRTKAAGTPEQYAYIDKYGHDIGGKVQAFQAGKWIATHQQYDEKGRLSRQYQPSFISDGLSPYYTDIHYDIYDRAIKNTLHTKDKDVVTEHWYQGLIEVDVDAKGRQVTTYRAANGETSKIEDQAYNTLDYVYDPYGNLLSVALQDGALTRTRTSYDRYGRKTKAIDLDKGTTTYSYNAFGELTQQTNAANQVSQFGYDQLGRMTVSLEPERRTCWVYGTAANHNAGRLLSERIQPRSSACSVSQGVLQSKQIRYDGLGHIAQQTTTIDGVSYAINYTYDANGRLSQTTYPSNALTVQTLYNANGYLYQRKNATTGAIYQQINEMDAQGHVTDIDYGNGAHELRNYTQDTGLTSEILLSKSTSSLADMSYRYDPDDQHLLSRSLSLQAAPTAFTENYQYSKSNPAYEYDRLYQRTITVSSGAAKLPQAFKTTQTYDYDELGNITYKSNVGYYRYNSDNPYRLMGVCASQGCQVAANSHYAMQYDAKGNVVSSGTRSMVYTSFDKVSRIQGASGTDQTSFLYDGSHNRYRRVDVRTSEGQTTTSTTDYVGGLYEKIVTTGSRSLTEQKFYVGNAVVTLRSNNANNTYYLHSDAQGSTTTVTDKNGNIVEQFIYDPWGKQEHVFSQSDFNTYISPASSKGYTGHEGIQDFDLIHMNGRIYDPTLARFLQADPNIQFPTATQGYNRYSYVLNNPMNYTDPSGYFLSGLKHIVKKYWRVVAAAVITYFTYGLASGWAAGWGMTQGFSIAVMGTTQTFVTGLSAVGTVTAGVITGSVGGAVAGALQTGSLKGTLRGGLAGAVTGAVEGYANNGPVTGWANGSARVAASAAGGCAAGKILGGSCRKGARIAAMSQSLKIGMDYMAENNSSWKVSEGEAVVKPGGVLKVEMLKSGENVDWLDSSIDNTGMGVTVDRPEYGFLIGKRVSEAKLILERMGIKNPSSILNHAYGFSGQIGESGSFMSYISQNIPGVQSASVMHDRLVGSIERGLNIENTWYSTVFTVSSIPPAFLAQYVGLGVYNYNYYFRELGK